MAKIRKDTRIRGNGMADIHVMSNVGYSRYRCVLHDSVPSGNNRAGFPWKDVLLNAGVTGTSSMTVGTGAGQITQMEYDSVVAGDLLELVTTLNSQGAADPTSVLTKNAVRAMDEYRESLKRRLDDFGRLLP